MKITKKYKFLSILLLLAVSGCSVHATQPSAVAPYETGSTHNVVTMARRFHEQSTSEPTVVESAMELSEKYAALSNEAAGLKQKNKELTNENRRLNDKLVAANTELQQTQKELTEANDLLVEMRVELNNWKSNVIGFREEMREADIEELKALFKILTILGGEVETNLNKSSASARNSSSVGGTSESESTDSTLQVKKND